MSQPDTMIDPSARCPFGGGHKWRETDEDWRDGRPVQVLVCERCGAESVGYLEVMLGWPVDHLHGTP